MQKPIATIKCLISKAAALQVQKCHADIVYWTSISRTEFKLAVKFVDEFQRKWSYIIQSSNITRSSASELELQASVGYSSQISRADLIRMMTEWSQEIQVQLPLLKKFSGIGDDSALKFPNFVDEFLLRFELEVNHTKIRYLEPYLEGLALDTFLNIPEHTWEGKSFRTLC